MRELEPEDRRQSVAKKGFSIYQVNRKQSINAASPNNAFKNSFQGLKVQKRKIGITQDFDQLPGLNDELMNADDKDIPVDQLSATIMNENYSSTPITMLSSEEKIKLWAYLLLYSLGRASMVPFVLEYPQPPAFKMFYRCLLVIVIYTDQLAIMLAPLAIRENKQSNGERLAYVLEKSGLKLMISSATAFLLWMYFIQLSSHHINIIHAIAFGNIHFLLITLMRVGRK